ncbi:DUF2809 domain-containing protein [Flavobacterium succinicans]|uniref:DUF2809 domain-containing protein n=1 Tax=Flavobacterium succinicans TaxID=29536 RepID=A0A199XUQ4_9FLAO|nr:DUF2809 domain-containing protein [Flavobacterium succinicans]OAZ05049.1 hypothetical protein FLB_09000 [Flavobacterium succinicans]
MKPRFVYFILALLTIVLGITSRKIVGIPLFVGDILYAVLVYFGFRWLFVKSKTPWQIGLPLLFCFLIEIQQLSTAAALVAIRETTLGHYVLGQGFLWIDLFCYTIGIGLAYAVDRFYIERIVT